MLRDGFWRADHGAMCKAKIKRGCWAHWQALFSTFRRRQCWKQWFDLNFFVKLKKIGFGGCCFWVLLMGGWRVCQPYIWTQELIPKQMFCKYGSSSTFSSKLNIMNRHTTARCCYVFPVCFRDVYIMTLLSYL